jgi:gluconate 2-dehydrogenase gamma chain
MDDHRDDTGMRLTRRRLLVAAGGAAAATGLATLPGCGETSTEAASDASVADANVNAPQLRNYPYIPSQAPLGCVLFHFFTAEEARAVEAFTARLIPGTPDDPGAREACVTAYIDRKLAEYETFATTTYFQPPFAKPAEGRTPGRDGDTIFVSEEVLPRYGFQSSLTPQQSYRRGLAELDRYSRATHGQPFDELAEATQDAILGLLEDGKIASFVMPTGDGFFTQLQNDANEGMFADPAYGGNRDFAGWRLIGYPGAQRAYTPEELKNGPNKRTIQGLHDMPAMHPGRPEDHVILPIEGTRRIGRSS